jgi:hypothetical protein
MNTLYTFIVMFFCDIQGVLWCGGFVLTWSNIFNICLLIGKNQTRCWWNHFHHI